MNIYEVCLKFFNMTLKMCRTSMEAERDVIIGGRGGGYHCKDAKLVTTNQHI
jgi:hypothetical protein